MSVLDVMAAIVITSFLFAEDVSTQTMEIPFIKLSEFIREKDVLKQWPMSKATLIRARKKGLPFVRLGAFVCYRPEDLEDFFCQPRTWKEPQDDNCEGGKNRGSK